MILALWGEYDMLVNISYLWCESFRGFAGICKGFMAIYETLEMDSRAFAGDSQGYKNSIIV